MKEHHKIINCIMLKKLLKKSIPREQPNQNKEMKIADSVLLGLFMKNNEKCNISHSTGLDGIQMYWSH